MGEYCIASNRRFSLICSESGHEVPIYIGYFSTTSSSPTRTKRICICRRPYISRKNGGCRICCSASEATRYTLHIYLSGKNSIENGWKRFREAHCVLKQMSLYTNLFFLFVASTLHYWTVKIKALSNQKFRDFSLKYGSENVGLITGDMVCMV